MIFVDSDLLVNWLLDRADADNKVLTSCGLNCLIFLAHGWALNLADGPLCKEMFIVSKMGPVLPSVEIFGEHLNTGWRMGRKTAEGTRVRRLAEVAENATLLTLLDRIWVQYKGWSDSDLQKALTAINTPWDVTWNKRGGNERTGMTIPERLIRDAFAAVALLQPPLKTENEIT